MRCRVRRTIAVTVSPIHSKRDWGVQQADASRLNCSWASLEDERVDDVDVEEGDTHLNSSCGQPKRPRVGYREARPEPERLSARSLTYLVGVSKEPATTTDATLLGLGRHVPS